MAVIWEIIFFSQDNLLAQLPPIGVLYIDHIVGNQPDLTMEDAAKW